MRSGVCSVQQALTAEAASVLKQSLSLARRRGHAQVTPLHVAATLLTSSSSSSNLLRRACLKSHPHHLASSHPHPLQCRALELCFNVALNRLPASLPSSSSLIHANPSLSNALIAALKRAQAHQRRGCIEQQQQHQQQQQQQQQQPLLAIKVELEQLIISILDDPSVSRVMREAGFSSTTVKTNLEVDTSAPSSFFFDSQSTFWNTHLLKPPLEQNPVAHFSFKEDLKVVFEVMLRKQERRNNTVVVGDSAASAEGVVAELMGRVERGEAPDDLKHTHFIRLQLSYLHLRLMSRCEVDMKVSDLKARVASLASQGRRGGVVIFVGDLRWALDEERRESSFSPVEHLIEQVGLMATGSNCNKVWLMATASYQTYMRCQVRHPSLESQWALQAVMVPSGGLKLSLHAPSVLDSRVTKHTQYPFQIAASKAFNPKEDEDKLLCCAECTFQFEKEASIFKLEANDTNSGSSQLPSWLKPHKPDNHQKDHILELRRKWSRSCRSQHYHRPGMNLVLPLCPSPKLLWSTNVTDSNKSLTEPLDHRGSIMTSDVRTTLALGNPLFSEVATSPDRKRGVTVDSRELCKHLQENIPWQSETIPLIVESLLGCRSSEKKGTWLLVQGTDRLGKRRLARVAAECLCGSTSKIIYIDSRSERGVTTIKEAMSKDPYCLVLIEDVDRAHTELLTTLAKAIGNGFLKDSFGKEISLVHGIFILTTSTSAKINDQTNDSPSKVLKMRMRTQEISNSSQKRKNEEVDTSFRMMKKQRSGNNEIELDLNVSAEGSDLTHEIMDSDDEEHRLPVGLLDSICTHITMDERHHRIAESYVMRLSSVCHGQLLVEQTAIEGLMEAMGWFLESEFERWVKEVFELSFVTVRKGGKVELGMEGKEGNLCEYGFLGSVLPKRIHVD